SIALGLLFDRGRTFVSGRDDRHVVTLSRELAHDPPDMRLHSPGMGVIERRDLDDPHEAALVRTPLYDHRRRSSPAVRSRGTHDAGESRSVSTLGSARGTRRAGWRSRPLSWLPPAPTRPACGSRCCRNGGTPPRPPARPSSGV